jgi:hypothetical protein
MFCECNCHVRDDKPTSEEAAKLEEIMRDRMLKEASPVFLWFLEKGLTPQPYRTGDDAR